MVMFLGGNGKEKTRILCPLYPGAGEVVERIPKKLGEARSEGLRGRSPDLSEVSGNHADHQLHRRPGGH